ncbi:hypothetical protein X820_gp013 [Mycobacterium phage CloudWang3]|uniref:DUF7273 domain-containing protein n=1 Tax=Mycobacterium phage CloudWang3 TaxID=1391430 RepID=V5R496_9CAUD|nr:hypothetical protein X820_gp013 [Mycobacterium phage CloudWang3]AHB29892.1 hypothetical protein CLOUDWANG3_102 [Mycobacterium phage CloudWang3]
MLSTNYDLRYDLSEELWTVAGLLADEGKESAAYRARNAAMDCKTGIGSTDHWTRVLCDLEDLIGE